MLFEHSDPLMGKNVENLQSKFKFLRSKTVDFVAEYALTISQYTGICTDVDGVPPVRENPVA